MQLWSVYDEDGELIDVDVQASSAGEALSQFYYATERWHATPQLV